MKRLLGTLLSVIGLSSCSNNDPAPAPALTGETWTLQSRITVATPKDKAPETPVVSPITEKVTMTFHTDTRFSMDVKQADGSGRHIKFPAILGWPTPFIVPQTLQVTELSAHKLVTERHWESIAIGDGYYASTNYVATQTYTR